MSNETEFVQAAQQVFSSEVTGQAQVSALGATLIGEFNQAENDRRLTELRWLEDLRQFKGQYDPTVLAKLGANRSKAFVRKTRVKVVTVDARMMDLLFPANADRNWSIAPTPKPTIAPEQRDQIVKLLIQASAPPPAPPPQPGQPPQPPAPPPAPPTQKQIDQAIDDMVKKAAQAMSDTIDDQLVECGFKKVARKALHSGNLYGTGILKGPLVEKKIRQRFVQDKGQWVLKTESYTVPFVEFVPLWRFFPDMTATELEHCRYVYERHLMTRTALVDLAKRKSFKSKVIQDYVLSNPKGVLRPRFYDSELKVIGNRQSTQITDTGQFEVFERWGWLTGEQLKEAGVTVPTEKIHESFFSNVWLLPNGEIIRAVLQPINGVTWPYHIYYYDKDETSIFAEGLSAIARDDQEMVNAGTRMTIDHAAISAGPQVEGNVRLLGANEKNDEIFPFKFWPRSGEDPGSPALRFYEIASHTEELVGIVKLFEDNLDEVTAVPRYAQGENVTNGAAGTSSGLSQLMGAMGIVIKDRVTAWDECVGPFVTSLYRWNMQFSKKNAIKGDFDVKATGAASLVAKEVRAQQLDQFAQMTANPMDAPYIKRDKLLRQRAEAHDLVDVIKTEDEVLDEQNNPQAQQAAQMQQQTQQLQMATMQANLSKLQAQIEQLGADTLNKKLSAAYAAMEAAGVAVTNPNVAPAGDELLRSAGWIDATPGDDTTSAVQTDPNAAPNTPGPVPQPSAPSQVTPQLAQGQVPLQHPQGPHVGMHAGIETQRISDGGPQ